MLQSLSAPEVVRCYFDESFDPPLPAMILDWVGGPPERLWELPEGFTHCGPAPRHFGISIRRLSRDDYAVRLLWDRTSIIWQSLSRMQLLASALHNLLGSLGTDLREMLDQPIQPPARRLQRVA
jgi:hypothetical protein